MVGRGGVDCCTDHPDHRGVLLLRLRFHPRVFGLFWNRFQRNRIHDQRLHSAKYPPLFPVIIALLLAWVALTWVGVYARRLATAGRRGRLIRAMGWTAITVGVLGTVLGIAGVAYPNAVLTHFLWLTPAALGLGTVSMLAGFWMLATSKTRTAPRPVAAAEQASLVVAGVVIVLALFWLTDIFATTTGDNRAQTTAARLWPNETGVVLDTSQRLNAPSNLIVESPLAGRHTRRRPATTRYISLSVFP